MVIGSGKSLSVLEVVDTVRSVTGASLEVRHGPARAGRDAGGDRRSEPRARRRVDAAVMGSPTGVRGVWEEWSAADLDTIAAGLPVGAGERVMSTVSGQASASTAAAGFDLDAELGAARADGARRGTGVSVRSPAGLGAPLAIVIPAYNEEPTVAGVVAEIPRSAAGLKTEVIVVVDGARDATASRAAGAGALVCDVPVNRGQGAALRLGYWLARARGARVIATIDADGQYEPEEIGRVVQPILDGQRRLRVGIAAARRRADHRPRAPPRRARVRRADQRAGAPPDHRSGVRDPRDALRGDRGGQARAAAVPGLRADDLRRAARLPAGARCRPRCATEATHATATKKGGNFGYGVRFARAALRTWMRDRKAARTRLRPEKIQCS